MSNAFEDREKAFEAKYRMDQETEFKVSVRRDKLLGLWAAEQMGMSKAEADAYARSLIEEELTPGHHDVEQRILRDFAERRVDVSPEKLHHQITRITVLARDQIVAEQEQKQA